MLQHVHYGWGGFVLHRPGYYLAMQQWVPAHASLASLAVKGSQSLMDWSPKCMHSTPEAICTRFQNMSVQQIPRSDESYARYCTWWAMMVSAASRQLRCWPCFMCIDQSTYSPTHEDKIDKDTNPSTSQFIFLLTHPQLIASYCHSLDVEISQQSLINARHFKCQGTCHAYVK